MSGYALDQILGENSFINEIVWAYESGGRSTSHFHRKHDVLFVSVGHHQRLQDEDYTFNGDAVAVPRNRCEFVRLHTQPNGTT